jgi:hypothetical protein
MSEAATEADWLEGRLAAAEAAYVTTSGTHAELLARAGCSAEHALWSLRYGADWRAAWAACPRADWLAEAFVMTSCREGSGANHRRLVGWIGAQVGAAWDALELQCDPAAKGRVERSRLAVRAARTFAVEWGLRRPGGPPDIAAFSVQSLFQQDDADWTPAAARAAVRTPDGEARALVHAALRAACSALSGDCPGAALRALAWHHGWSDENAGLAGSFVEAFACPEQLRSDLPA